MSETYTFSPEQVSETLNLIRTAILEGGFGDLADALDALSALAKAHTSTLASKSVSHLVRPLMVVSEILAEDTQYLFHAVRTLNSAAHLALNRELKLNQQIVYTLLELTEKVVDSKERAKLYQQAAEAAPASSPAANLAIHKAHVLKDQGYFSLTIPADPAMDEEALVEQDIQALFSEGVSRVVRQHLSSGAVQFSLVVPRKFSRGKLEQLGVKDSARLKRLGAAEHFDRIIIPAHHLPSATFRDIDFQKKLKAARIHFSPVQDRKRNESGHVTSYCFSKKTTTEQLTGMGVDTAKVVVDGGRKFAPVDSIDFKVDQRLICHGKWLPDDMKGMKLLSEHSQLDAILHTLNYFGIEPEVRQKDGTADQSLVIVKQAHKKKLNQIIFQQVLLERNDNLKRYSESIPAFTGSLGASAYNSLFGSRLTQHKEKI